MQDARAMQMRKKASGLGSGDEASCESGRHHPMSREAATSVGTVRIPHTTTTTDSALILLRPFSACDSDTQLCRDAREQSATAPRPSSLCRLGHRRCALPFCQAEATPFRKPTIATTTSSSCSIQN